MKKLIVLIFWAMTVVSCELFSSSRWAKYEQEVEEDVMKNEVDIVYCEDENGNRH